MALRRKFIAHLSSGPVTIPDPGQAYSPDEVRQMAAADYPELTSAAIVYNDPKDGVQEYGFQSKSKTAAPASASSIEFKPSIGRKG